MDHKIFLVEDNPDHALLIQQGLKGENFQIAHYTDGMKVLDFFRGNPPVSELPDLILLDLKLPGADGFDVLKEIKSKPIYQLIPVVMLTTSKYQQEINQAYQLGACGFVTKPEDFQELLLKLSRIKDYWLKTVELPKPL